MNNSKTNSSYPNPTPATRQHVLAASGNQCSFPGCTDHIFDLKHETLVGDIAHIKGRSLGSARYDENQSPEENCSFMNLTAMCKKHHAIIDGNKAHLYPVQTLQEYKTTHESRVANDGDRTWIRPPNTTHTLNIDKDILTVSWWKDRTGNTRLYTEEQLAICNVLLALMQSFSKVGALIETLPTIGNDVTVGSIINQDWVKFETSAPSVFGHFAQLMAMAPNITFSEFIGFIDSKNDPTALTEFGAERLQKVIEGTDTDVRKYIRSDKVE